MTAILVARFSELWREANARPVSATQSIAIADPFTPIYRRGDRIMAWMVAAHLALAALLAPIYDTWRVTAIVGLLAAAMYYLCMAFAGGRFVTRNMAGFVLQGFCALHIYQMQGLAEMHFFFFTAVTAMIVYQDWRAMWLGVFAIIAQHTLFSYWHNVGVHPGGHTFFEPDRVSLLKISFHFGIALVQVAFAAYAAHVLRGATERAYALATSNHQLELQESRLAGQLDVLEARESELRTANATLTQRASVSEEQVRQSQKMEAVGRLAGGVAHDFNNLLTVIEAHAEFALSPSASGDTRRNDIEAIQRAASSGAQLTRQLLTFSRKQAVTPNRMDLNAALRETLGMIKRLVGKAVEVTAVEGRSLAAIWADSVQVQQVLLNLVVNARDAMPNGGRLRFETSNVTVRPGDLAGPVATLPPGQYVKLTVGDTGVGMSSEVRARIFEPFFTTKGPGHGTGLGLASVYGIVKQSNGHILVDSEPGTGTTFALYFPVYVEDKRATDSWTTSEHPVPVAAAHILVVEDQTPVRTALCRALTQAGYVCEEANNAAEAMDAINRDGTINLIITEMVLPGKSGIELVADVHAAHPTLPVLVLSGFSEDTASQSLRVPANAAFVEKPVSPTELVRRVRRMLDEGV